jgi:O-antigen/teichoic acid export membrane protein
MTLFNTVIGLINQTIYPKVAREKDMGFVRKILSRSVIFISIGILLLQLVLPKIILYLGGEKLMQGEMAIRVLLLSPIVLSAGKTLSRNCMIVFDKYKALMYGMSLTSLFYIVLIVVGHMLSILDSVLIFSIITLLCYIFELCYRYIYVKRVKIF